MTYTYRCRDDEHTWDVEHSIHVNNAMEEIGLRCPECGGDNLFKYLGNMKSLTVKFIGTGWYVNDSALDAVGMPENIRNSPETRERLKGL